MYVCQGMLFCTLVSVISSVIYTLLVLGGKL